MCGQCAASSVMPDRLRLASASIYSISLILYALIESVITISQGDCDQSTIGSWYPAYDSACKDNAEDHENFH